jgi:hypothetical protein
MPIPIDALIVAVAFVGLILTAYCVLLSDEWRAH